MGQTPGDWGFDEYITDPTAGGWYWQKTYTLNGKEIQRENEVYCPDVVQEVAVDFLRRHREQPFFLPTGDREEPGAGTPPAEGHAGEEALTRRCSRADRCAARGPGFRASPPRG